MNPPSDNNHSTEPRKLDSPRAIPTGMNFGHLVSFHGEVEAKHRLLLVQWINNLLPSLNLPINITDEMFRASLSSGTVLCQILNRLRPGSVNVVKDSDRSLSSRSENVQRFLTALEGLGLPQFEKSDLEKGSTKAVVDCLLTLRAKSLQNTLGANISMTKSNPPSPPGNASSNFHYPPPSGGNLRRVQSESRFESLLRRPARTETSVSLIHHVNHKFHDLFQPKHRSYADLPAAKISEMMKPNALDNAPTQSLLSVVHGILEETVERRNGEMPHRLACLLRKLVQEIERRISTQAEYLRTRSNLFKAREEKYLSRIRVLETIVFGTREETEVIASQIQQLKTEKTKKEEEKKAGDKDVMRLMKEQDQKKMEISTLQKELETTKRTYEVQCSQLEAEAKTAKGELEQMAQEYEHRLEELRNKVKELEAFSDSQYQNWNMKQNHMQNAVNFQFSSLQTLKLSWESIKQDVMKEQRIYAEECNRLVVNLKPLVDAAENYQNWNMKQNQMQNAVNFQFSSLQTLKLSWESIKQDVVKEQRICAEEYNRLGVNLKPLVDAAENYQVVLAENRKLFNEVQELKGNIRVYCRIRPFLMGQKEKQSIVENIGENDLVLANPFKQGKDARRLFKFNKVFSPASTQVEVYSDIQPYVQSVLDGYNVCMFAYGQTGSGKTYTMSGPSGATSESLGVNYRALNDLFRLSTSRTSSSVYEVGVQMVEIYNEQVRDLLSTDSSSKKLGILNHSQPKGLAVPDASLFPVKSPSDVIELMDIGLKNRAISATAMNERSSRSHSVVSIHVHGTDFLSGSTLHGNLHLVDLAGSERVDRSEVTGDRLKEAQHINKSLAALGDVIFALSQKGSYVPYRNSKLTQLLQTSLGGQAKTLMFVQINSDIKSFSETMSTLKFAERVSGVELGAARSSKDGRDVIELMEQVASMKDTILKKDEEIERLQLLKDVKNVYPGVNSEKRGTASLRYGPSSPSKDSTGGTLKQNQKPPSGSNKHLEADSKQPMDDHIHQNEFRHQSEIHVEDIGQNIAADAYFDEKLDHCSENRLSLGTETECSSENSFLIEGTKSSDNMKKKSKAIPKNVQAPPKSGRTSTSKVVKDSLKSSHHLLSGIKRSISIGHIKAPKRWQ